MLREALASLVVAAGFAAFVPASARAEVPGARTRYQELVAEALSEFEAARYEEALVLFEHAHAEKPSARALRGIAKTLFELRLYARSLHAIDAALASPLDPLTGALRDDLVALRERTLRFVGRVVVTTEPRSTQISIDGTERTCAPDAGCVLDLGRHTLRASAPDHESAERTLEVGSGAAVRLAIRLAPLHVPITASASRTVPIALG
ncbi:MAG: PEGA domain-containing protein, partial [Proteobacteria bacterium]